MISAPSDFDLKNRKPFPGQSAAIPYFRFFSEHEFSMIKKGFYPKDMDDPWFLYFEDDSLNFYRVQTGYCIFMMTIAPDERGNCRAVKVLVNRDPQQYSRDFLSYNALLFNYLLEELVFSKEVPFPENVETMKSKVDLFLRAISLLFFQQKRRFCRGKHVSPGDFRFRACIEFIFHEVKYFCRLWRPQKRVLKEQTQSKDKK